MAFVATGQIGEAWAVVILEEIAKGRVNACTTAFYLQELLEVYERGKEPFKGKKIYFAMRAILPDALEVAEEDFERSYELYRRYPSLSPRELLHAAVMERNGIGEIFSLDGPVFEGLDFIRVIRLPDFLAELGLDGEYVYERFRQSER